jgi:hypothetical protein
MDVAGSGQHAPATVLLAKIQTVSMKFWRQNLRNTAAPGRSAAQDEHAPT